MEYKVSVEEAAAALDTEFRRYPWFLSVGVGETESGPTLFAYVRSSNHSELARLNNEWRGFTLLIRAVGTVNRVYSGDHNIACANR